MLYHHLSVIYNAKRKKKEKKKDSSEALTLQPLSLVALDHDAELQHQLRGTF